MPALVAGIRVFFGVWWPHGGDWPRDRPVTARGVIGTRYSEVRRDLDRVKTHAGGHVELEVGMMHAMQPPQRGHGVKEDVLEIDREVEDHDRDDDACPPR